MMPATVQAKSFNHKGLTNSPISRRLLVNSTSGNTANGNCKLKTTWLKTSKFPVLLAKDNDADQGRNNGGE